MAPTAWHPLETDVFQPPDFGTVVCPYCHAPVGGPCVDTDGKPRAYAVHVDRTQRFWGRDVGPRHRADGPPDE